SGACAAACTATRACRSSSRTTPRTCCVTCRTRRVHGKTCAWPPRRRQRWLPPSAMTAVPQTLPSEDASPGLRDDGLLQLMADHVPALIAYYEAEGIICRFANRGYAETFGWDAASVIGRTLVEVIGEDAQRLIQPHIDRVLREKVAVSYERALQ